MAFDAYAERLCRRKWQQDGKRPVVYRGDEDRAILEGLTEDRTSLRLITPVQVAFLTPAQYRRFRRASRRARQAKEGDMHHAHLAS